MKDGPAESRVDGDPRLSVIIPTKNEQDHIRECIESVFATCRGLVDFEVILVDSNSSDRTVDIASEFPIAVLQIPDDELTTPGAGRYVGTKTARGDLLLFVDGDMVLEAEWLPHALECIQCEEVAAVDGQLAARPECERIGSVDAVRGVALYDAIMLESVGGFHPFLQSLEDIELGYRLKTAGYELKRLPETAAIHPQSTGFREMCRRWRRGYTIGPGQVLRESASEPRLLVKFLSYLRYRLGLFAWLCLGLAAFVAGPLVLGWLALSAVGFGYVLTQLGPVNGANFVAGKALGIVGLTIGLGKPPAPRDSFPLEKIEQLQQGPVHGEHALTPQNNTHTDHSR